MPFKAFSVVGGIVEGVLVFDEGVMTFVEDEDGPALDLTEMLKTWDGKKVRINVADLEVLENLVEMGMTPGREQEFVDSLTDEQRTILLVPQSPPPSGDLQ